MPPPAEWLAQQKINRAAEEAVDPTPRPPSEPQLLGGATAADLALVRSLLPEYGGYKLAKHWNNEEKVEYVWRTGLAPDRSTLSRLSLDLRPEQSGRGSRDALVHVV